MILTKAFNSTKKAVNNSLPVIKKQIDDVRESARESQTRKIIEKVVLEEAARITTRAAMTVFDEKEVAALQKQFNDALAKGEYDTAQSLMSTLLKIEGK